jgi:hypothetical protein
METVQGPINKPQFASYAAGRAVHSRSRNSELNARTAARHYVANYAKRTPILAFSISVIKRTELEPDGQHNKLANDLLLGPLTQGLRTKKTPFT